MVSHTSHANDKDRPLLLGLNNPLSDSPRHALFPEPATSTGGRLLGMIDDVLADPYGPGQYLNSWERANLWPLVELPPRVGRTEALRDRAGEIAGWLTAFPAVVVLGRTAWQAVAPYVEGGDGRTAPRDVANLPFFEWRNLYPHWRDTFPARVTRICVVPHPSGRSRYWNDREARRHYGYFLVGVLANHCRRPVALRVGHS